MTRRASASDFDALGMYAAMDVQRTERGLSWRQVAEEIWNQSIALNQRRQSHPISPSTLSGIAKRADCSCQHALFILRWLGRTPESFRTAPPAAGNDIMLPAAGPDKRLRWDLSAVYAAPDARRRERGLTWPELAQELRCTEHQLTGIRRARFAVGMRLIMRITQWLERPAAAFIYPAEW